MAVNIAIILGPYRSLTTLTAALFELNKNSLVLNHGGIRVLNDDKLNFLENYSKDRVKNFIKFTIKESTKGKRGLYGGSIRLSHAFDDSNIRFSKLLNKINKEKEVKLIIWKESGLLTKKLRENNFKSFKIINDLLEKDSSILFFRNIRNPIDCAISNLRGKKQYQYLDININESTPYRMKLKCMIKWIIDDFIWYVKLQKKHPNRFFYFHQNDLNRRVLINLAKFLGIDPDKEWIKNCLKVYKLNESYPPLREIKKFYYNYLKSIENYQDELKPFYRYISNGYNIGLLYSFSQKIQDIYLKISFIRKYIYKFLFEFNLKLGLIGKQISKLFINFCLKLGLIGRLSSRASEKLKS